MFLLISKYIKPLSEVEKVLEAHRVFLSKYYASGHFICSGRLNPRTGGCIICKAESKEDCCEILQEDPFVLHNISEYEIIEVQPTMYAEGFEKFI
ncbi:MAG TPA: YciI family protein [Candidatus Cloacimonadota bacterium]|nr:YciI family protein [Candidatus Cloacimonadota bacterium]